MAEDGIGGVLWVDPLDGMELVLQGGRRRRYGFCAFRSNCQQGARGWARAERPGVEGGAEAIRSGVDNDDDALSGVGGWCEAEFAHREDGAGRSGEEGSSRGAERRRILAERAVEAEDEQRRLMQLDESADGVGGVAGADEGSRILNAGQAEFKANLSQGAFSGIVSRGKRTADGWVGSGEVENVGGVDGSGAASRDLPGEGQGAAGRLTEVCGQQDFGQRNGKRRHFEYGHGAPWIESRPGIGIRR